MYKRKKPEIKLFRFGSSTENHIMICAKIFFFTPAPHRKEGLSVLALVDPNEPVSYYLGGRIDFLLSRAGRTK
jgi:hypothetical protein